MNELQLDEIKILNKYYDEENNLCFDVEPVNVPKECPYCGGTCVKNGSIDRLVRDLPILGEMTHIIIKGNRFLCTDCKKTFVQEFDFVDTKAKITNRLKNKIQEISLDRTLQQIAADYNLAISTVSKISDSYVNQLEKEHVRYSPEVLGMDEAHLSREMRGVFVDIERRGIVDIIPSRAKPAVIEWLENLPDSHKIKIVTMDMWRPYKEAVELCLPNVNIVIDRFHVAKMVNICLDNERKKIIKSKSSAAKMKIKYALLKRLDKLKIDEMLDLQVVFNEYPELKEIHIAKEELLSIYDCTVRADAEIVFSNWLDNLTPYSKKVFAEAIRAFNNWYTEIFNFFDYRYTNGVTEALNNTIKSIEKNGRGYSFKMLRARVLYGTPAYKRAKTKTVKKKPVYRPGSGSSYVVPGPPVETIETVLVHGDYVDIDELFECLENK